MAEHGFFSFSLQCDRARDDFALRLYHPALPLGEEQVCEMEQQKAGIWLWGAGETLLWGCFLPRPEFFIFAKEQAG